MTQDISTASGRRTVQRETLGPQIAQALRQDILFGVLKPGTRLTQDELCEQFGTSRMPVRDALRQLMSEGLLVRDVGKHSLVAPLSRNDISDAFLLEGMLHGEAARRVATRATEEDLARLEQLHSLMQAASDQPGLMAELNWRFHREVNHLAASRKIIAALKVVSLDVPRDYLKLFPETIGNSNDQHARLLRAIRGRDPDAAAAVMREHVVESGRTLIAYLEMKGVKFDS